MKKAYYWLAFAVIIIGIGIGIFYLQVIRPGSAQLPDDVVLETAFGGEYDFGNTSDKVKIIEFMYTHCPDVCPVTTLELSKLRNQLDNEGIFGEKVEFITITIDPKRDTPEILRDYAGRFEITSDDDGWLFLTATSDEASEFQEDLDKDIKKLADALNFLYRDPGSGEIIHSTWLYFLDQNDNLLEKFVMGEDFDRERAYKRIKRHIN